VSRTVPLSSFAFFNVTYVYGLRRVVPRIAMGGHGAGIMHMGQPGYGMGPEWMGFHVYGTKATTSSKGLTLTRITNPHIYLL
jgi:hypothetical protein